MPRSGRRDPPKQQPGLAAVRRRLNGHAQSWDALNIVGRDEHLGSQIGLLQLQGAVNHAQADAARYFARFCAASDRTSEMPRRNVSAQSFERGSGGRSDDEALARLQGSFDDYERRIKRASRRWDEMHDGIDPAAFSLLMLVAVHDRQCPAGRLQELRDALASIARRLHVDGAPVTQTRRKPRSYVWRAP